MRRLLPSGLGLTVLIAAIVAVGGSALGYFSSNGIGSASAAVTQLSTPTLAAPTAGTGQVTLSWGAATAPGSGAVAYYVERDGGEPAGTCPTESAPAAGLSCVDSEVPVGTHTYVVTATWRSWTAKSATKSATVTIGAVTHFVLSAVSTTPAAGASDNLTITAKDEEENTVTSYAGSHNIVFSGAEASPNGNQPTVVNASGTAINFGTATALTFTSGVASVSSSKNGLMNVYDAGPASIVAKEGSITTTPLAITVSPLTASKFTVGAATTAPNAGAEDDLTVTAVDTYGNTATSYAGTKSVTFSGAEASPGGNKPTVASSTGTDVAFGTATSIIFTAGVAKGSAGSNGTMALYKSGTASIKATEGTITTTTGLALTVSPGAASSFTLSAASATPAAGASDNLTLTAKDAFGNVATSYSGSRSIVFSGAEASPSGEKPTVASSTGTDVAFGTATPILFTAGIAAGSEGANGAMKLYKSSAASIKATEGSLTNSTALPVTVAAGAAGSLTLTAVTTTPVAAATDNLTLTAKDAYANTATSYAGSKNIVFSGAEASPSGALPTVVDNAGTQVNFGTATALTFTSGVAAVASAKNGLLRLNKAGAASVTATDGTLTTAPLAFTVSVGAAARYGLVNVVASKGSVASPCLFTCTITSVGNSGTVAAKVAVTDSVGNTVSGLGTANTVKITTTGGTIAGTPLTIATTGLAVSTAAFTYTAPASGNFTNTITVARNTGTTYTSATATASK